MIKTKHVLITSVSLFALYLLYGFYFSFTNGFKKQEILKSRFEYVIEKDFLEKLDKKYTLQTKNGSRFISLNSGDTSRLFLFDFLEFKPFSLDNFEFIHSVVKENQFNNYSGFETPEGFNIYLNSSIDSINFDLIKIQDGEIIDLSKKENSVSIILKFNRLSFGETINESSLIIDSPSHLTECNIFIGEINNRLVVSLFVSEGGKALDLNSFERLFIE